MSRFVGWISEGASRQDVSQFRYRVLHEVGMVWGASYQSQPRLDSKESLRDRHVQDGVGQSELLESVDNLPDTSLCSLIVSISLLPKM